MNAIVSIGNSDNKLTQQEWSEFVRAVDASLGKFKKYFRGFSGGDDPWQNACWWICCSEEGRGFLLRRLAQDARKFQQESIAVVFGETIFIEAKK